MGSASLGIYVSLFSGYDGIMQKMTFACKDAYTA